MSACMRSLSMLVVGWLGLAGLLVVWPSVAGAVGVQVAADAELVSGGVSGGAQPTITVKKLSRNVSSHGLVRFDLAPLPDAPVARATLRLWVSDVHLEGMVDIYLVVQPWNEGNASDSAPDIWGSPLATIAVTHDSENHYVTADITSVVADWLAGTTLNYGLALLPRGSVNVSFDSKENASTSHAADIEVALAGPAGAPGPPGSQGIQGDLGPQGLPGTPGVQGSTGATGPQGLQGAAGPQGLPGTQGVPGAKGLTWKGPWSVSTTYAVDDAVSFGGGAYVAVAANLAAAPDSNASIWNVLAVKGDAGTQGPAGAQGPTGPQGFVGPAGPAGPQGDRGEPGPTGPQGTAGSHGSGLYLADENGNAIGIVDFGQVDYRPKVLIPMLDGTIAEAAFAAAQTSYFLGTGGLVGSMNSLHSLYFESTDCIGPPLVYSPGMGLTRVTGGGFNVDNDDSMTRPLYYQNGPDAITTYYSRDDGGVQGCKAETGSIRLAVGALLDLSAFAPPPYRIVIVR